MVFRIIIEEYFGTHNQSSLFLVLFHTWEQLAHQQLLCSELKIPGLTVCMLGYFLYFQKVMF